MTPDPAKVEALVVLLRRFDSYWPEDLAAAILAAGYVLESDAKEEAAAIADRKQAELNASAKHSTTPTTDKLCAQTAHSVAAAIRFSIHKKAD